MNTRLIGIVAAGALFASMAQADTQTWNDSGPSGNWCTNEANWAGGAVWTNGNSAVFTGGGGLGKTVDVAAIVNVANITFQTNGYVIADTNNDGTLTVTGMPSVITVVNAGDTGTVRAAISGSGGFVKAGNGTLNLTGTNTYSGTTIVSNGTLRLAPGVLQGLGATGTGNETVIAAGATLDVNSSFTGNLNEDITIQGTGVGGIGALVNTGPTDYYNVGYRNLTLAGDATLGVYRRFDMSGSGTYYGNGYTLTKIGAAEMAVSRAVNNSPIVINAGTYTIQYQDALGSTDYPTTLNGTSKLQAWGSYTIAERMFINGGTLSSSGDRINTFKLTGNLTLSNNVVLQTDVVPTNTLELAGVLDGPGGFTRSGSGFVIISGSSNTYSGPATVSGGSSLWVGRTVGGTGVLGSGTATNNGTLYANSGTLSAGTVVNNNSGSLYLNPPTLTVGRIVNISGTVYGTSIVQAASGVVNASTWNSYSGSFGSSVVTNASGGTLNLYTNILSYGQFVNGGKLSLWQPMTLATSLTFNGGSVYVGDTAGTLSLAGTITAVTAASLDGTNTSVTEVSGKISGPGGLTRSGDGLCFITGDSNDYTGPTTVNVGKSLWVGKPAGAAAGRLGSGAITNNGALYFDSAGAYTNFSGISGYGVTAIRYGGQIILSGGVSSNSDFHVANGSLTLTNGAIFSAYSQLTIANRADVKYVVAPTNCLLPTNVLATVTVNNGCALIVKSVTFGNGNDLPGGTMTGILNQVGGVVRTTGSAAEENGVRLGHYPQSRSFYNMMGGTLYVEGNWDLGCATDGEGWFNMTGGEVFTKRVMLNERDADAGFGRLTVAGGTLNVGSLTGSSMAISNSITADLYARYLVEFGGAGGVVRAVTNLWIPASATLIGTGTNAITFDSQAWTITMTNKLSGTGGLSKTGSGTLVLSGNNTYSGATRVLQGALTLASATALPAGGQVLFGVAADDAGGRLVASGDLSLAGLTVGVANPEALDKTKSYTIATYSGALTGGFSAVTLPDPWYVYYDWNNKRVQLSAAAGTLMRLK